MSRFKETIKQLMVIFFPTLYKNRLYRFFNKLDWNNLPAEEGELLLMKYFIGKDTIFFDIGANIGIYTFFAENYTAPQYIYAFEPIPDLYMRLKRMFTKSNIFRLAFSNETSEKKFKIPLIGGHEYKSRGTLNTNYRETGETRSRVINVKTDTLDNFIKKNNIENIGFIKIDVEGHELKVIEGGVNALRKLLPVLQVEIEQRHYKSEISEIIDFINALGYACYYLDLGLKSLVKLDKDPRELQEEKDFKTSRYIHNFIFVPKNDNWEAQIIKINSILQQT